MKVIITRKRDVHTFTHVKTITVEKKGWLIPSMDVSITFNEGATSKYKSDKHNVSWNIDPNTTPGMSSFGCEKIEVFEDEF